MHGRRSAGSIQSVVRRYPLSGCLEGRVDVDLVQVSRNILECISTEFQVLSPGKNGIESRSLTYEIVVQQCNREILTISFDERSYRLDDQATLTLLYDSPAFPERLPDRNKSGYDAILHKRRKPPSANICHLLPSGALYNVTPVDWS